MKISLSLIATLVICVAFAWFPAVAHCDASSDRIQIATEFLQQISKAEYEMSTEHLDAQMKTVFLPDTIKKVWASLVEQCGEYIGTGAISSSRDQGYDTKVVVCRFKNAVIDARVVFNEQSQINGLWFRPHVDPLAPKYTTPSYVKPASFTELPVVVGNGEWKLPGTLSIPKGNGPYAAVVLVHGSGAHDRDETIGPNKPFKDIAQALASLGIAVLRYEKRTKVYGEKLSREGAIITVKEEVTDDALQAVKLLRNTKRINPNKVFVLGHSLGGMLVPRIGQADAKIAGLISVAGPTRPLEELVIEQVNYLATLDGNRTPEAVKKLEEIKQEVAAIKRLAPGSTKPGQSILGAPVEYWLDLLKYHPAEVAKSLKMPIMVIQGGRDYQVSRVDYEGSRTALGNRKTASYHYYPSLNHLLQEGSGKSTPDEYSQRKPVFLPLIRDIAQWVKKH